MTVYDMENQVNYNFVKSIFTGHNELCLLTCLISVATLNITLFIKNKARFYTSECLAPGVCLSYIGLYDKEVNNCQFQ